MKVKLCDVFDLQMGKTPSRNNLEYWDGEHKWVAIGDLGDADKYISHTKECISDAGVAESGIKAVPAGTVIMSFKLSIGKTAITTGEIYTNEAIMAFIDKKAYPIDANYIYHLFSGMDWSEGSNKAVMGVTLNKATLSQKTINIPDIFEQQSVARILDKLDNLIFLRKQQLAKLDKLVKAQFVEMFGDRWTNNMGWPCKSLRDCATFHNGKAHEQVVDELGEYILVTSKCIASDQREHRRTNTALFPLQNGDICMVMSDVPNGRALAKCMLIKQDNLYTLNQRICCFRNYELNTIFFLYTLNRHEYLLSFNDGDSQTNLRKDDLLACPIILPPIKLQEQFSTFVEQTDKYKLTIQQGLDKLEVLKESLMQEYFG